MAYSYTVNYSTSANGPWTSAGTVTSPTDTVTGLLAGTAYFFQIITIDSITGLQSAPVVTGPLSTASQINSITLNNLSFPGNAPSGTVIAAISVATTGAPFTGQLSLPAGANNTSFQLSSPTLPSNLLTQGTVPAGAYSANVTATQTGYLGSPFTKNFSLQAVSTITESAPGTLVGPAANIIASSTPGIAGTQNTIFITTGAQVSVNGVIIAATGGVTQLYYINHTCYQFNGTNWFGPIVAGNGGTGVANPVPSITGIVVNPNNVTSTTVGSLIGAISVTTTGGYTFTGPVVMGSGNVAGESAPGTLITGTTTSIVASATPGTPGAQNTISISAGAQVVVNGVIIAPTNGVTQLYYINHTAYQFNGNTWFGPIIVGSGGTGAVSNPVVANPALFSISGANLLAADAGLGNGSYVIRLTASPSGSFNGVVIPPFTQLVTISVGSSVPLIAQNAGFTQLVFSDDFTTNTTIAQNSTVTSGFNWYWGGNRTSAPTVMTTSTAASINNGNTSGGPNASPNGGILVLNAINFDDGNATLVSMPISVEHNVTSGPGAFLHFYAEWYMQFNTSTLFTPPSWPGVWTGTIYNDNALGLPRRTELDFYEYHGNGTSNDTWGAALHDWAAGNNGTVNPSTNIPGVTADSEWHTFGCLWIPGTISFTYDNQVIPGGTIACDANSNFPATDLYPVFMIFTAGTGLNEYVDWFRIWQAPGSAVINTPDQSFTPPQG